MLNLPCDNGSQPYCNNETGYPVTESDFYFISYTQSTGVFREIQKTDNLYQAGNTGSYLMKQTTNSQIIRPQLFLKRSIAAMIITNRK